MVYIIVSVKAVKSIYEIVRVKGGKRCYIEQLDTRYADFQVNALGAKKKNAGKKVRQWNHALLDI